ncbi:hypothetical protein [Sphingobacterium siyangense]|uniref:hypothetical protein n=1 Tax=Sphingobacterium siyangense TaxID=459529 RepID=UPI002FDE9B11
MKKIVDKIAKVLQVILLAPVKLPNKVLNIAKYIAFGLGIVDSVLEKDTGESVTGDKASSADVPDNSRQEVDRDKDKKTVAGILKEGGTDALE